MHKTGLGRSVVAATRLLAAFQMNRGAGITPVEKKEVLPSGREVVYDYYPSYSAKPLGTIVVLHGMTPVGQRDDRLIHLNQCMAYAGYIVLCPEIPDIKRLEIDQGQIDQIAELLRYFASKPELCPAGKLGALAPSFSAGLVMSAATQPHVQEVLSSLCALGGFSDVGAVLEHFFSEAEDVDPYGMMIVLKNFIKYSIDDASEVEQALHFMLHADFYKKPPEVVDEYMQNQVSGRTAQMVRELFESTEARQKHLQAVLDNTKELCDALDTREAAHHLKTAIYFLHGDADPVIPPEQSVQLYGECKAAGVPAALCLSPFLSHGDAVIRISLFKDIYSILRGFAFFFRHVSRPAKGKGKAVRSAGRE